VRSGNGAEHADAERCQRDASRRRWRRRPHRKRKRHRRRHRCRRSVRAIGDDDNVVASLISTAFRTAIIIVVLVVVVVVASGDGDDGGGDVTAVFTAEAKANSMMRRWRWRGLFLGGVHGARGQELAHILRIMCLFVGLEYRRPREGFAA